MEKTTIIKKFGERNFIVKLTLTVVCVSCCFWHVGFYKGCPIENHFLYSFFHANVFHLIINLMVLWNIRNRISVVPSLLIAVAASFLPMYVQEPTMGLSGFLFAAFGIMWGKTGRWKEAARKVSPFILFTMLLDNVNGLLHLWCFIIGFLVVYLMKAVARNE